MINAAPTMTATETVPQNITLGLASTSAPIHSNSSDGDLCWGRSASGGWSSPGVVVTERSLVKPDSRASPDASRALIHVRPAVPENRYPRKPGRGTVVGVDLRVGAARQRCMPA